MIDDDECGAVGGMRIGRETEVIGDSLLQYYFARHVYHIT
jgi:hypothetical protein